MSLSILVLDFWAGVSDYLQRSTLSSLRARSVPASYPAERSALTLSVCFRGWPRLATLGAFASRHDERPGLDAYLLVSSRQSACSVPYLVRTRNRSVSGSPIDCFGNTS
jgi:hypothetical protein